MARLNVFNHVTVDGYFVDAHGQMDWAYGRPDSEWDEFVASNAKPSNGLLLFGRKTYEMMASFWPTPAAEKMNPVVARGMNEAEKIVFSRTLKKAAWSNTRLVKEGLEAEVKKLKKSSKKDLVIMGSGSVVSQLAQAGLVDQFQLVVNPLALGAGRTLFEGAKKPIQLELTDTRRFKNGNVVLTYLTAR